MILLNIISRRDITFAEEFYLGAILKKILILIITFICMSFSINAQIMHLEIGAANYSADSGTSRERFLILEDTAEKLIEEFGPSGTIYLNDIDESGLDFAKAHLDSWLFEEGYTEINVEVIVGDYTKTDFPRVKTAHMKNPDYTQLPTGIDKNIASLENREVLDALERLALNSEGGLIITSEYNTIMSPENWPLSNSNFKKTGKLGFAYYAANYVEGDGFWEAPREYIIKPFKGSCDNYMRVFL